MSDRPTRRLAIFTRAPVPGQTKTRLCPPLAPEDAARLAAAFLQDEVAAFSRLKGVELTVVVTPDDAGREVADLLAAAGLEIAPQGPGDLGERLLRAFRSGCVDGSPLV